MGGLSLPGGASSSSPLAPLNATARQVRNNLGDIQNAATDLPARLPNTETPAEEGVTPRSASRLDDPGFQNRVNQREVAGFDPENGLQFNSDLNLLSTTSVADVMHGHDDPATLDHALLKDHSVVMGAQVETAYQTENWRVGLRVDTSVAASTEGVDPLRQDLQALASEGKKVLSQMQLIQRQLNQVQTRLNQSPDFQRLNQLATQASTNPTSMGRAEREELQTLLQSDDIQNTFNDLNGILDKSQRLMAATQNSLEIIGDGTRRLQADAQVRGAAEAFVGYRSDAIPLGDDWHMQVGAEVAGIVPIPVGTQVLHEALPAFRSAMHKVSSEVQVTTLGVADLQDRLSSLQNTLGAVQGSVANAEASAQSIGRGNAGMALAQGIRSLNQLNTAGTLLNQNLGQVANTLDNLDVEVNGTLRSIEASPGVGVGLRDVSLRFQGSLSPELQLELLTGAQNSLGYLSGTDRLYDINMDSLINDQDFQLDLRDQQQRNVFHDFYTPTLYQGAHLSGDFGAYRFEVQGRAEVSLEDQARLRGGVTVTQHFGQVELLTGISNSDLFGTESQTQYQLGLSYADMGGIFVESDSLIQPGALNARVAVNVDDHLHVHGGMVLSSSDEGSEYIGTVGFGGALFAGDDDDN